MSDLQITAADLEAAIASEHYFTAQHGVEGAFAAGQLAQRHADTDTTKHLAPPPPFEGLSRITIGVLVLRNGTRLVGVNYGSIDPARHSEEMGRKEARKDALQQLWPLLAHQLRQGQHERAEFELRVKVSCDEGERQLLMKLAEQIGVNIPQILR